MRFRPGSWKTRRAVKTEAVHIDYIALNFVLLLEQVNCVNVYRIMVFDSFQPKGDEDILASLPEHDGGDGWVLSDLGKINIVESG